MDSLIRENAFILRDMTTSSLEPSTGITRQNIMRLKVNRIALVQELQVDKIMGKLQNAGVIELEDVKKITSGATPQDKTRILLDLLPTKSKNTEWYKHFRESLQNPDAGSETRRRYKLLVNFLDNTVIHRPTSQMSRFRDTYAQRLQEQITLPIDSQQRSRTKLPHYSALPEIGHTTSVDKEEQKVYGQNISDELRTDGRTENSRLPHDSYHNMTLVQGLFHQWLPIPDNFRPLIGVPHSHLQKLMNSENPEDQALIVKEKMAMNKLQQVEIITALARHKQLPSGCELCLCDAIQDILNHPELYHLYLKHFVTLAAADVILLKDICSSFRAILQTVDSSSTSVIVNQVTQTGLKLASLLTANNKFSDAGDVLVNTIEFLKKSSNLESWVPRYQAYIKLMQTYNLACQPDKAESAYFEAVQMQYHITMLSFGQTVIFDGALHAETSYMMLEHGSLASAFGWSRRALREVDPEDPAAVVRVLCVAINSYCAQWLVRKAELLAIYVVQYARRHFGERHPLFIESLLHFCHFSSEMKQDPAGLQASRELLDVAEKTYGCESIHVAVAHRSFSKCLMSMGMLDADDYYTHAIEAVRIARATLGLHSPVLHHFLHTLASALQWKAMQSPKEVYDATLRWAEAEATQAFALVTDVFGEISLKSAQMLLLLGQIYSRMNKVDVAEKYLKQGVDYMKLCQPSSSIYLLQGMADLASFYKIILKPELAVPRFQFVVDHAQSSGCYTQWIFTCFQDLAQLYRSLGEDKNSEAVQVKLSQWLKANPITNKHIDYSCLKEEPEAFKTFLARADIWVSVAQKAVAAPVEMADVDGDASVETTVDISDVGEITEAFNGTSNINIQED